MKTQRPMINLSRIAIMAGEHNVTYGEMLQRIAQHARRTPKGKDTKTVIFSENREGWIYSFYSVWLNEGIAVPVDASSAVSDVAYILDDCKPDAVWVSRDKEAVLRESLKTISCSPAVHVIDDCEHLSLADEPDTSILPWTALSEPDNDDTAVIIYTSGTTGSPKGVMLSYRNLMSNVHSATYDVPIFNDKLRALVLLPLHHAFPLMCSLIAPLYMGGGVAICPSFSAADIMDTLRCGQIGLIVGVPRLWQTLYAGIKKKIDQSLVGRMLFALCCVAKSRTLSRLVFRSVRKKLGGHVKYCASGGAALDEEIGEGLRTLGLDVYEGYGLTETAPLIAFTRPGDFIPGCSGLPLPGIDCKLVDGELCVKGSNVMKGYYNRPDETRAVIDSDGYLHTGDLATIDSIGRITITGRTKEIIVLSNGKNVQPSEIEYKLEKFDTVVCEAAVVQDGDKLCAIIVPQPSWAATLTDGEVTAQLKREVLEPYNSTVSAYKKIMSVLVYRGELPRTRLGKLQRFKISGILKEKQGARSQEHESKPEPVFGEYLLLKRFIESEKGVKVHAADHIEIDLALDSLDRVSLQDFIERTFGISVGADEMPVFPNMEALARHVAARKTRMDAEDIDWHQLLLSPVANLPLPSASFMYRLASRLLKYFFCLYNRLTVDGRECVPAKGACILAPNHQSYVDGAIVLSGILWSDLGEYYFYATEEHVGSELRRKLAARSNVIVMERAHLKTSILKLAKVLREGHRVIIFPEGARTHDGGMVPFKKTFAILAKELQVPVVPVCIKGAFESLPRGSRFLKPGHIEVRYMPPLLPFGEDGKAPLTYEELTRQTEDTIEHCLNEKR